MTDAKIDCPLPDKPSELIRLALDDLRRCEWDPRYKINMGKWHETRRLLGVAVGCSVCFAGAVMAKSCDLPLGIDLTYGKGGMFTSENVGKFDALDRFRIGHVERGLKRLGIKPSDVVQPFWGVPSYSDDRKGFHKAMYDMADHLEENGL